MCDSDETWPIRLRMDIWRTGMDGAEQEVHDRRAKKLEEGEKHLGPEHRPEHPSRAHCCSFLYSETEAEDLTSKTVREMTRSDLGSK